MILFSLSWPGYAQSAEWAEVHRIEVSPGQGRSTCPPRQGWAVLLEPEGDRFAVFASRIMAPDGPFDDIRLVFETAEGKRHVAACVSSAGLRIIGISFDDDCERLDGVVTKFEIPWLPVFLGDQTERMAMIQQTGTSRIPRYFVIDRKGILNTDRGRGQLVTMVPGLLEQ